jgi:hypothetical protein
MEGTMVTSNAVRPSLVAALALLAVSAAAAADTLTVTASMNPAPAGVSITFTFSPGVRNAGDTVTFDFGDGSSATIDYSVECALLGGCSSIQHAYAGSGSFTCSGTGKIGGATVSGSLKITITSSTADQDIFVATGAHLKGFNNVNWRTDLAVNNPNTRRVSYEIALLLRDQDNTAPVFRSVFFLEAERSARYNDLLYVTFGFTGAAAIRITPIDGSILLTSRTYNQLDSGTYGQSVPGVPRGRAIVFGQDARLIGLSHDPSLASGYRTNLGFLNESPAGIGVDAEFYVDTGVFLGRVSLNLLPYEYRQLDKVYEQITQNTIDDGYIVVRTTTAGAKFLAYAVLVDNVTGDPTYVGAQVSE